MTAHGAYDASIAGQTSRGFGREPRAVRQLGAAGFDISSERVRIDVHDDLIALGAAAALRWVKRFRGNVLESAARAGYHAVARFCGSMRDGAGLGHWGTVAHFRASVLRLARGGDHRHVWRFFRSPNI